MSTRRLALALACLGVACSPSGQDPDGAPGLGLPASNEDVARVFWSIFPDGENLPPGSGTAAEGRILFQRHCQACHGPEGAGEPADRLVGGQGTLGTKKPIKTVGSYWPYATTLWDYINRSMPFDRPGELTHDQVYAVTAYILSLNAIIGPEDKLDAESLAKIEMPNKDGFVADSRPDAP